MTLEEVIINAGTIASAIAAVIGLLWKFIIKPLIVAPYRKRKEAAAKAKAEEDAFKEKVLSKLESLSAKQDAMQTDLTAQIQSTQDDLGLLQWYKLKETHSRLMEQGWASDDDKEAFARLYDAYKARGRNSVAPSFMDDVLELPLHPST